MLRAVYVRTLKPDVSVDDFVTSWMPEQHTRTTYPAAVSIARSLSDPREVMSVFDVDVDAAGFADALPALVHPDSEARMTSIVESTHLAGVFEIVDRFGTA